MTSGVRAVDEGIALEEGAGDVVASTPAPVHVGERLAAGGSATLRVAYGIDSMAGSGGTELHAVRLAERARSMGVEPLQVTLNGDGPMRARYAAANVPVHVFPVRSLVGGDALRQVRAIASLLRRERIDVVHTHDCYTNFLMVLAARLAGVGLIVASKRWTHHMHPQHAWTNRVAFRVADVVLANSEAVATTVVESEWIARHKVAVHENFLDPAAYPAVAPRERVAARDALSLSEDHVVFAIVAQLRPEKDHAFLLRAFAAARNARPDVRLLVAGDGPARGEIESLVSSLGLTAHVRLLGHVAHPRQILAAADVAVLSSRHEGSPNALIEAMALGLPSVSTAAGGVVDVVRPGTTGLTVGVGDEEGFVRALREMASDSELRRRIGAEARREVLERFGAAGALSRLSRFYRERLARSRRIRTRSA